MKLTSLKRGGYELTVSQLELYVLKFSLVVRILEDLGYKSKLKIVADKPNEPPG